MDYDTTGVGYVVITTVIIRHFCKKCCILILFGSGIIAAALVFDAATSCAVSLCSLLQFREPTYITDEFEA
jgi:hypothetical protein